jgi:predicted O-methyltransferase YrrM
MHLKKRHTNPYKNRRKLPVGDGYILPSSKQLQIKEIKSKAMIEFGEPEFIFDIPRLVDGGVLLNLGCAQGGSAALLAKGLQVEGLYGHVHTVDIYPGNSFKRNRKRFREWGLSNLITQHGMTTLEAAEVFREKEYRFNFLFIDADHSYEGVKEDYLAYFPMMNPGGLVAFHDTNQEYTDKVLRELVFCDPRLEWEWWVNRIKAFRVL